MILLIMCIVTYIGRVYMHESRNLCLVIFDVSRVSLSIIQGKSSISRDPVQNPIRPPYEKAVALKKKQASEGRPNEVKIKEVVEGTIGSTQTT